MSAARLVGMVLNPLTAVLWAVFLVLALVAVVSRIRGRTWLGLGVRAPAPWRGLLPGAGIGAMAIGSVFLVELARGTVTVSSISLDLRQIGDAATFFVPWAVFEEIALRCLLLVGVLALTRRTWVAVLASAVVFGLAHAPNDAATWLSIASATLGGVMYALAFTRTGRVWLPLSLHLSWNLSQAILGVPVSGETSSSTMLVTQTHEGAWWLTGGAYGPEGGLVGIAARLLVIGLLLLSTRWVGSVPVLRHAQMFTPPERSRARADVTA